MNKLEFLYPVLRKIEDDTYIGPKRKFGCTLIGAIFSLMVSICFKGIIKLLQIKKHPEKVSSKEKTHHRKQCQGLGFLIEYFTRMYCHY